MLSIRYIQRFKNSPYPFTKCFVLVNRCICYLFKVFRTKLSTSRHDLIAFFIIDKHTRIAQERLCSRQIIVRSLIALLEFFNLFHSSRLWFLPLCPHIHTQPQRHHQRQQQTDHFFHHTFLSFPAKRVRFSPLKR